MLHEFLAQHRSEIIARTRAKVRSRSAPRASDQELQTGIPIFLDQLTETLRVSSTNSPVMDRSAAKHGGNLMRMGFTIAQVVHDYGDVCQAVTELATEIGSPISVEEFHTLNRCLDDAIAEAVTEYTRLRESTKLLTDTERLGAFVHELRNKLGGAILSFEMLKSGRVGITGSTGAVLDRNLRGLRDLIDRRLAEVRIESGQQDRFRFSVPALVEEIELESSLEATSLGIGLTVLPVEPGLEIEADRSILAAALSNLLQNAFKFTRVNGNVSFSTTTTGDRVLFSVEDECGGLPAGSHDDLFRPFTQQGANRTGLGLGLAISRKGVEANGGQVDVRDLPGKGCVFTISMPRPTAA